VATETRTASAALNGQSTGKNPPSAGRATAVMDRNHIRSIAGNSGSVFSLSLYYSAFHYITRNSSKSSKNNSLRSRPLEQPLKLITAPTRWRTKKSACRQGSRSNSTGSKWHATASRFWRYDKECEANGRL